jgi:hypothetical protein
MFAVVRMAKTRMIVLGQKNAGIIVSFMPIYTNGEHVIEAYGGNQSDEERKTIQEWVDKTTPVGCDPLSEYAVSNCKYYDTSGVNSMSNVFFLRCCTVPPKDFVRYGDAFDYDFVSVSPLEVHLVATGESLYILYKEKQGEFEAGYYKVHVLAKIGSTEEELVTDLEEDEEVRIHCPFSLNCTERSIQTRKKMLLFYKCVIFATIW